MNKQLFKCGTCVPMGVICTFSVKSMSRKFIAPTKCPFGYKNPKWKEVME